MNPENTVHLTADVGVQDPSRHLLLLAKSVKDELSNLEMVEKRKLSNRETVYIHIPHRFRHRAVRHSLHFYGYYEYEHGKRQLFIPLSKILNQFAVEELYQIKSKSKPLPTPVGRRHRFPCDDVAALEEEAKEEDHFFEFHQHEESPLSPSIDVTPPPLSTPSMSPGTGSGSSSRKRKREDDDSSSSCSSAKKPCFGTIPWPDDIPPRPAKKLGFCPDM